MAEFGKPVEIERELSVIYLEDGTTFSKWLKGDEWIALLYGELLFAAGEIIYNEKEKCPIAHIVSVNYESNGEREFPVIKNHEFILTNKQITEFLDKILKYAEEREMYEECASIFTMIKDYEQVQNSGVVQIPE
jgi:hypothetical protein